MIAIVSELTTTGISVYPPADEKTGRLNNQELGKSSTAGAYAIGQTAASRVFTNMYVLCSLLYRVQGRAKLTRSPCLPRRISALLLSFLLLSSLCWKGVERSRDLMVLG